jgi:hypothetical protein
VKAISKIIRKKKNGYLHDANSIFESRASKKLLSRAEAYGVLAEIHSIGLTLDQGFTRGGHGLYI